MAITYLDPEPNPKFTYLDPPQEDTSPIDSSGGGILSQTWNALKIPEKVIGQGYQDIAAITPNPAPTGNLPLDITQGTPKILADSAAQVLPKLYSRGALLGEMAGNVVGGLSEIPQVQQLAKSAGGLAAKGIEATTGIPAENVSGLFKNPMRLFNAPTKAEVDAAYKASEMGNQAPQAIEDIVADGTASSPSLVKKAGKALLNPEADISQDPNVFLEGRKALDKEVATINSQLTTAPAGKSTSALKDALSRKLALREQFNNALDVLAPQFRQADALASQRYSVLPFRHMFLPGKINFISPTGIARAVPGLPAILGAGVSGLGLAARGAAQVAPYLGNAGGVLGASLGLANAASSDPNNRDLNQ